MNLPWITEAITMSTASQNSDPTAALLMSHELSKNGNAIQWANTMCNSKQNANDKNGVQQTMWVARATVMNASWLWWLWPLQSRSTPWQYLSMTRQKGCQFMFRKHLIIWWWWGWVMMTGARFCKLKTLEGLKFEIQNTPKFESSWGVRAGPKVNVQSFLSSWPEKMKLSPT